METRTEPDLQELDDPAFFARWAVVRARLVVTPPSSPERSATKQDYDTMRAEYRRRMDGN